ncbi:MAG: IPT/TIG domain-containing protein [Planctomycetota bacterium]
MFLASSQRALTLVVLSFLLAAVGPTRAQDVTFVADSTDDVVYRLVDLNGDGSIEPLTEVSVYYDDTSSGPDLSSANHLLHNGNRLLLLDGGTLDAVFALEDLNADGDANDAGEITVFFDDSSLGLDLGTPGGMAFGSDGALYVCDDSTTVRAILRMRDNNADGDANDDGEFSVFYDSAALSPAEPITDPESIAIDSTTGFVYVGDSTFGIVFRLADLNGDGDAMDALEATIFYSIAGGVPVTDIDALQVDAAGGVYVIDEDTGTVLYLLNSNGDGDALDPGEARVFLDGAAAGSIVHDPNDAVLIAPGRLLLADGTLDRLYIAEDLNADGDALDLGELRPYFDDAGALLSTPSAIAFVAGGPMTQPPVITSVAPTSGPVAGGNVVDIFGSDLGAASTVRFGLNAASFSIVDNSHIAAIAPTAATASVVDVLVEAPSGASTLVAAYTYLSTVPVLAIESVAPGFGAVAGGNSVTIVGGGWDAAQPLAVVFGGASAVVTMQTASSITATAPAHVVGAVDVTVSQASAAATAFAAYRYLAPFVRGDANRNGVIDISDAIEQLRVLYTGTPSMCFDAIDANDDDAIDLSDATYLLAYLFQSMAPPPPPFPNPGLDPGVSTPGCMQ